MFFVHFLQVVKIVWAFRVDAFMDDEVFAVLFVYQSIVTMRTAQGTDLGETVFLRREICFTNLALDLPFVTVITVKIRFRSIAERAGTVIWDVAFLTPCNRLDLNVISVFEVRDKQLPIPFMVVKFNLGEFVSFELLVLWRVRIVKSPLPERNISADKVN